MVRIWKTWDVHGEKISVPEPGQYSIEGTKLEGVRERLAARGLKSPWLRNAAWRYDPRWHYQRLWPSIFKFLFRGAPIALGIVAVQIVVTKAYHRIRKHEEQHFHGFTKYVPKSA